MVSVPTTPGRLVQIQEQPRERFRYAESRNFVGRAIEQAGRALGDAAQDWDQVEAVYDTAAVKKLENTVTESARETLWTGDDPYFNKQGFDAAEARVSVEERFKELREQALSQTKNDRQRNMLAAALDKRLGDNLVEVAKHATGQLNVELQKQTEARLIGFQQDAVQLYSDPENTPTISLGESPKSMLLLTSKVGRMNGSMRQSRNSCPVSMRRSSPGD